MADNSDFQQAIEEMNALWCMLRTFNNPHAAQIWSHARVTVCFNPISNSEIFEKQQAITPFMRLEFLKQLAQKLETVPFQCTVQKVEKIVEQTIADVFNCSDTVHKDILKNELFERSVPHNAQCVPQMWSGETVDACTQFMQTYGFKEITRSLRANEDVVSDFIAKTSIECAKMIDKTHIDPYLFGMGAQLAMECLEENVSGYASPYGVLGLDMTQKTQSNTSAVFFHEWFHMIDHAAFYAGRFPQYTSPLTKIEEPLRELHKNVIRMSVNKNSSIDPYNNLISIIEILGRELNMSPQIQKEYIQQMKEVFHSSKKDRRENLNTFLHTVVLDNKSDGDLYPFIDKGIQTFDVMSSALKGFHKYLQKGYSEFYAVSLQMDDNYYHIERKPLKWYQKRKPYYSKPTEILARSAEQFCAKELGWGLNNQLGYPQKQEARRVHELFTHFFKLLATVRLTPSNPTRKFK